VKQLSLYLKKEKISFEEKENSIYFINEKKFYFVSPIKNKLFNKSLQLLVPKGIECDFWIFKFGGVYYYTPQGEEVQFNRVKYIGKCSDKTLVKTHLGVHGPFELMVGSGNYEQWGKKAKFLGYTSVGICEENTLAGCMKFQQACQKNNIKSILGMSVVVFRNDKLRYGVKCYAKNEEGWQELLRISNYINTGEGDYIKEENFYKQIENLFIVIDPNYISVKELQKNTHINYFWQLDLNEFENNSLDKQYLLKLKDFIDNSNYRPVLIKDTYYVDSDNKYLNETLQLIGGKMQAKRKFSFLSNYKEEINSFSKLFKNEEKFFTIISEAIDNAEKISEQCNFTIEVGKRHLPRYYMKDSEKKLFKNTRGRLATIKDLATHQFILRNFSAKNYWIGLQYFCGTRSLKWVDGSDGSQTNFSAWDIQWSNTDVRCGNKGYMPVHYTTATPTKALRWRASGPEKWYLYYLVEYPTGGE
jgi:hypothetical protein